MTIGDNFYPRPPRGGRRRAGADRHRHLYFYPRPPRGGRHGAVAHVQDVLDISIHALREEGDVHTCAEFVDTTISIHALREEGDPPLVEDVRWSFDISIHALREEGDRSSGGLGIGARAISIHALREEGDTLQTKPAAPRTNFYPRPPRGGRLSASQFMVLR